MRFWKLFPQNILTRAFGACIFSYFIGRNTYEETKLVSKRKKKLFGDTQKWYEETTRKQAFRPTLFYIYSFTVWSFRTLRQGLHSKMPKYQNVGIFYVFGKHENVGPKSKSTPIAHLLYWFYFDAESDWNEPSGFGDLARTNSC